MVNTYVVCFGEMQQRVKAESSQIAVRGFDDEGGSLFESLVFDEAYEVLFREYFYGAEGEITRFLSAYLKNMPAVSSLVDTSEAGSEDFIAQLVMPSGFNNAFAKAVGINIEGFFKAYILYRWFVDKLPERAEVFQATYMDLGSRICADLNKRSCGVERGNRYW